MQKVHILRKPISAMRELQRSKPLMFEYGKRDFLKQHFSQRLMFESCKLKSPETFEIFNQFLLVI